MQPPSDTITLIIKLTRRCNLGCEYCYYIKAQRDNYNSDLSEFSLRDILHKVARRWKRISIVLHGGEPLLRPLSFFQNLLLYQEQLKQDCGTVFRNSIQTNGTVYTDSYATFMAHNHIGLGISLDGTKEIHDQARPFKSNNKGSFENISENIYRFRSRGIKPSAILVASKQVVQQPEAIYTQFKKASLDFKINELVPETAPEDFIPSSEELGFFYSKLFDIWFHDKTEPILRIRPLTSIVGSFWGNTINDCTFRSNCNRISFC